MCDNKGVPLVTECSKMMSSKKAFRFMPLMLSTSLTTLVTVVLIKVSLVGQSHGSTFMC